MGWSGHGCSRVLIRTPFPHAAAIRSAKTEGSMKRSPMMATLSDIVISRAQGGERFPVRARGEPRLHIGREHPIVAPGEAGIGRLRVAEMRRHPRLRAGGHVGIDAGRDRGDHRCTGGTGLLPVANTNV